MEDIVGDANVEENVNTGEVEEVEGAEEELGEGTGHNETEGVLDAVVNDRVYGFQVFECGVSDLVVA